MNALGRWAVLYAPAGLLLLAVVAAWHAGAASVGKPYLLPSPGQVWEAFLGVRGTLPGHIRTTLTQALLGLGIACVAGAATAALLAAFAPLRRAAYPLLVISQNIPMIVLAPLIIVWFGFGMLPKAGVVAIIGFFPIVVATTDGLLRAERDLVELARSFGASRLQILRTILVPSAVPAFFAGLQISSTYAVLGSVIAEWMGAQSGLGLFIMRAQTAFRVDRVFVAVIVIAAVSILLFALTHLAARLVMPWQYASTSGSASSAAAPSRTRVESTPRRSMRWGRRGVPGHIGSGVAAQPAGEPRKDSL